MVLPEDEQNPNESNTALRCCDPDRVLSIDLLQKQIINVLPILND